MNSKLQRLVSFGLGAIAFAVLTVSLGQNLRSSFRAASGLDASGYAVTGDCCTNWGRCAPCPPPPSRAS